MSWCSWLWAFFQNVPPFSFSIASSRCWVSSEILCSKVFLPRPKVRKVDKAKRRCVFHISPLLKNRPSRHKHAEDKESKDLGNSFFMQLLTKNGRDLYLWILSIVLQQLDCMVDPQSSQRASRWPPSPSCTQTQVQSCQSQGGRSTHSHRFRPAVKKTSGKSDYLQHITALGLTVNFLCCSKTIREEIIYRAWCVCLEVRISCFFLQFDH